MYVEAYMSDVSIDQATRAIDDTHAGADDDVGAEADGGEGDDAFADRNAALFARRAELLRELAVLATGGGTTTELQELVRQRRWLRARRALDEITTEIISFNLGLVRSYCRRFTAQARRDDAADFEAAGLLGLMRAIDSFDPRQGRFGQWAFKPIQREVLRAVRDADYPNVNPGDFERRPEILRAASALQGDDAAVPPSFAEIARAVGATIDQVTRVLAPPRLESVDQRLTRIRGGEQGLAAEVVESPDPGPDAVVLSRMALGALRTHGLGALDTRERMVLTRRFGLDGRAPEKLSVVGGELGLSREAVRQIEAKALAKVQHPVVLRWINGCGVA